MTLLKEKIYSMLIVANVFAVAKYDYSYRNVSKMKQLPDSTALFNY